MGTTADIYDERGEELASCETQFRSLGGRQEFEGVIETVHVRNDSVLVKEALATPGEGRVLVVDCEGSLESALMGDVLARSASENGWSGVIVNGAVRDSERLGGVELGVKALGTNPRRSHQHGTGTRGQAVIFGGVVFEHGGYVYADADGILVRRP